MSTSLYDSLGLITRLGQPLDAADQLGDGFFFMAEVVLFCPFFSIVLC
jgi:hypothetical protein